VKNLLNATLLNIGIPPALLLNNAINEVINLRWWDRWFKTAKYQKAKETFLKSLQYASQYVEHAKMDEESRKIFSTCLEEAYAIWDRL